MAEQNPIEEALSKIEVGIRQLKIQYDMFFSGAMPRQPFETRKELEIMIKTVGDTAMQRFADRYRFNSLASKYQTMVELWNKMLRAKEEGRLRPGIPGFVDPVRRPQAEVAAQPAPAGARARRKPAAADSHLFRVRDATVEEGTLRLFYDTYVEASRQAGGTAGTRLSYGQFTKQIAAKTQDIRKKAGCDEVTYSIEVKSGGVSLKARPNRKEGDKK
ncbi:MAG TPA: MXAN_5187 C-terminal domain-containing protein [Candidatus Polarisedimenticolia bacterium]|nr:MXAN_5187 C-terminal domain-containing protein [Candidatus Polarisedimenticolia bacterium]